MKGLCLAVFALSLVCLRAEDDAPPTLPPHVWFTETLKEDISWDELKQKLPGMGELKKYISNAPHLTQSREHIEVSGVPMVVSYAFNEERLYGWDARASGLDHARAIALADFLVPQFHDRFGPSTRINLLPSESDGPRDQISLQYLWNIKGREFALSLDLQPASSSLNFGGYRAIYVSGNHYIADADDPIRGILGGRNLTKPERVEIVTSTGLHNELHVLRMLHARGVTGSQPKRARELADFGQTLNLHGGRFTREEDGQRCLRLAWFRLHFPVTIWNVDQHGERHAEVHFSMKSLFPDGIEFEGKPLDLSAFEDWNSQIDRPRPRP